jgi:gliding motility-associated protein GldM
MAGGKLTPRQKMINLMYLVFIAMLALNMSKEVLSAFGLMNEKLEASNADATTRNEAFMTGLADKARENAKQYAALKANADKVKVLADDLNSYLGALKSQMLKGVENPKDYEIMDKGDFLDNKFFTGDKVSKEGQTFISKIAAFRDGVAAIVPGVAQSVKAKFNTSPVKNRDGLTIDWLDYHYKGFPMVASLTKLTQLQADVKTTESEVLGQMLQGNLTSQVSMTKYKAIVITDKSAFFSGEPVTGRVVLGRYDENTVPTSVAVNGGAAKVENGQATFRLGAGSVGEHDIKGQFVFMEGGKEVPIPIEGNYVVVPKPNGATISADKMNVVYRGVPNPISVSFAGISADKVSASAPGMRPAGKPGQYMLTAGSGNAVTVSVTGTLADGTKVSDKKEFRIKGLPSPVGKVRGEVSAKGQKSNLEVVTVSADMEDFDFPVSVTVTQFTIKIPGQPTVLVQGNKMDGRAKAAIAKAGRGDVVVIDNIKAKFVGIDQTPKRVSPCTYEVQ